MNEEAVAQALRDLVKWMYFDLKGAYGCRDGEGYSGQYEPKIKALAAAIAAKDEKTD